MDDTTHYTFEVQSFEWVFLLTKLIARHEPKVTDLQMTHEGGNIIYFIRRDFLPIAELAHTLGTTPEALAAAKKRIVLKPFVVDPDLPKPTVAYIGEA